MLYAMSKLIRLCWFTVDKAKEMLGTFSPQLEAYTFETSEEIIPSGLFVRGSYSARMKV